MHLESGLSQKERRPSIAETAPTPTTPPERVAGVAPLDRRSSRTAMTASNKSKPRAPRLGEVGKRQTLNVFSADGRDVSAEVGSEEAVVDETAFVKQPSVIFTRGKKGMHYTLLLLDYQKEEGSAPHHRLHWLVTDIPGQEFADGDLSDGIVLADFEPPRLPRAHQPRLYVLMVFEQRLLELDAPLGRHPDLQLHLSQRHSFPLTAWLRCNSPKMARIAACQQFSAHLGLHPAVRAALDKHQHEDQGELGDVEDSELSSDEHQRSGRRGATPVDGEPSSGQDKENQSRTATRKSKRSKLARLRRLLSKHSSPRRSPV